MCFRRNAHLQPDFGHFSGSIANRDRHGLTLRDVLDPLPQKFARRNISRLERSGRNGKGIGRFNRRNSILGIVVARGGAHQGRRRSKRNRDWVAIGVLFDLYPKISSSMSSFGIGLPGRVFAAFEGGGWGVSLGIMVDCEHELIVKLPYRRKRMQRRDDRLTVRRGDMDESGRNPR